MFRTRKWASLATILVLLALLIAACGSPATPEGGATASAPAAASTAASTEASTAASAAASEEPSAAASEEPSAEASAEPSAEASAEPSAAASAEASVEPSAAGETGDNKLEIFSWWTNGGEADGLNAMFEIYKKAQPNVEIVNATVAGGAGTNAKAVLQTRLQGGQPPDSWQVHAGRETLSYVDQLEPLTDFFSEEGLDKVMPPLLLEQLNIDGQIYTVPVNIHRSNILWYNVKVFEENNLEPPKTMDDFFTVAEALKAKGITPLAVGGNDGFEAAHLFESVLLAELGPEDYTALWSGDPAAWADERVATSIDTMARMLSYANSDRSALKWGDAMQLVLDGKAGMTIMGDWAHGYALSKGVKLNEDYGYAASPGTDGVFMWLSDSFGLAKGAPHPDAALEWLRVCGSKDGQDAFNPKKGSIPARTDADKSKYDEYLQWSIDQFSADKLAPSATHGASTTNAFQTTLHQALEVFSSDPTDTRTLIETLTEAAGDLTQ